MTLTSTANPWSVSRAKKTIDQLREHFPGYTDNELYAIWCVQNRRLPRDSHGKVDLEFWKTQAEEDGSPLQEGGFRVSVALYGRAQKAKPGVSKPPRAESKPAQKTRVARSGGLSKEAIQFAKRYDEVAAKIGTLVRLEEEMQSILKSLQGTPRSLLEEVNSDNEGASHLLKEASLF